MRKSVVFSILVMMFVSACGSKSRPHRLQPSNAAQKDISGPGNSSPTSAFTAPVGDEPRDIKDQAPDTDLNRESGFSDDQEKPKIQTIAAPAPGTVPSGNVSSNTAPNPSAPQGRPSAPPATTAAPAANNPPATPVATTPEMAKKPADAKEIKESKEAKDAPTSASPEAAVVKEQKPVATNAPVKPEATAPSKPAPVDNKDQAPSAPAKIEPPTNPGQCLTMNYQDHTDWFPGLFNVLATSPRYTGAIEPLGQSAEAVQKDPDLGFRYVDGSADGLLSLGLEKLQTQAESKSLADRKFAPRFSDVEVITDLQKSGRVSVQFLYEYEKSKFAPITIEGKVKDVKKKNGLEIDLKQTYGTLNPPFSGHLACMDADGGCQTTAITVQRSDKSSKGVRSARIVHRFGEARLTLPDQDKDFANLPNKNHRALAEYMANTANNSCLDFLTQAKNSDRPLDVCEAERLQAECGNGKKAKPAAKAVVIRSWAVAYGRAGFELALEDRLASAGKPAQAKLVVAGPLGLSSQRPMWPHALTVKGSAGIQQAHLIATDGGGNLNLQLIFAGQPNSHTRLNVTALFEGVRAAK